MKKNYTHSKITWNKFVLCLVALFFINATGVNAQQDVRTVDMQKINTLKAEGKLTGKEHFVNYETLGKNPAHISAPATVTSTGNCNCWIDRDTSWSVAAFDGSGASGGPGLPPDYRNDDWSTDTISLPFSFCYYNAPVNRIFINNNGNISIGAPYSTYNPDPFPNALYQMIAPFWSDCDTRNPLSGIVHYKLTSQYLIVQWDSVDYFNSDVSNATHQSLYNTYQLIITNGTNEIIPHGNNVSFCYKDMQWTTGDASQGTNGFGGLPATAGVNRGDGVHFLQLGLFDQTGIVYDGPYLNNDGVDALDNQYFYFKVCDSAANIAPIIHASQICDSVTVCVGDSVFLDADYLSPEAGQTTTMSFTTTATSGATAVSTVNGNTAHITVQFTGSNANLGYSTVALIGTDNGVPPLTSTTYFIVNVTNCGVGVAEQAIADAINVYPNPADENIYVAFNKLRVKNVHLILTNQLGQKVFEKTINETGSNNEVIIPSQKLPKGIYFLTIKNEMETVVKKIEVIHQ